MALRMVYRDYTSSFEDLLKRDKSVTIHHRNIQSMAMELFKVKKNLSNSILCNIFQTRTICYNLRSQTGFIRSKASTSQHRLNRSNASTSLHGQNSMRVSIKSFKEKIRKWEPSNCHYKLCQPYIHNLGYVNLTSLIICGHIS